VLSQDFKEFIRFLNESDVRYLVVGGYAVAIHGHPRYTKDVDIWIENSKENAGRLLIALEKFGFGSLGLSEQDFTEVGQVIQLGYPPSRIDILTSADGVNFDECYETKVIVSFDDLPVDFIGLDKLKENKRSTGRPQDLADLDALQ
jgi:hypothetical protein